MKVLTSNRLNMNIARPGGRQYKQSVYGCERNSKHEHGLATHCACVFIPAVSSLVGEGHIICIASSFPVATLGESSEHHPLPFEGSETEPSEESLTSPSPVGYGGLSQGREKLGKFVRLPLPRRETLSVQGEKSGVVVGIISFMKAQKHIRKGRIVILALVAEQPYEEKKIDDIPIVRDCPELFPKDLPGLPPHRQVEFQINLAPEATPIARAPCRLVLSELQELSTQMQELLDKGSIRPSSSPWGGSSPICQKEGRDLPHVHRLSETEQSDDQEPLSSTSHR
ncbi:hypothetical protein L1987_18618 [Smallanthus sonchifolius]|uniref:Uncharacterized protein n=1 Tax=Smallanthus sonchifolius TaxID=185202 RepID=A0ACB9J1S1_9ASTR|nr:hypothetical protein L1987_18618 [Smallanthus sonchifolius]